jgi:hypothetical protein
LETVSPPDLSRPPSLEEFERVVRLGLGRAALYLRRYDAAPYKEILVEAAITDWRYDADTDAQRERYLLALIDTTGQVEIFRDRIIAALPTVLGGEIDDRRRAAQPVRLLALWAARGDRVAEAALRAAFESDPLAFPDASVFVELHGMDGLVYAAQPLGAALLAGEIDEFADQLWDVQLAAELRFGQDKVWSELGAWAHDGPALLAVADLGLARARAAGEASHRSRQDEYREIGYDEVTRELTAPSSRRRNNQGWRIGWGRYAREDDLVRVARDFATLPADATELVIGYLQIFAMRAFPLDPSPLIREVRRGSLDRPTPTSTVGDWSADNRRAWYALRALENVTHPAVRQLGLDLLENSAWIASGAGLLERNAQSEDVPRVIDAFLGTNDVYERHSIGMSINKLSDHRRLPDVAGALCLVYELGPCSFCRRTAWKRLSALNEVPGWMAAEVPFDAETLVWDQDQ